MLPEWGTKRSLMKYDQSKQTCTSQYQLWKFKDNETPSKFIKKHLWSGFNLAKLSLKFEYKNKDIWREARLEEKGSLVYS